MASSTSRQSQPYLERVVIIDPYASGFTVRRLAYSALSDRSNTKSLACLHQAAPQHANGCAWTASGVSHFPSPGLRRADYAALCLIIDTLPSRTFRPSCGASDRTDPRRLQKL